jgi:hypothetical protein
MPRLLAIDRIALWNIEVRAGRELSPPTERRAWFAMRAVRAPVMAVVWATLLLDLLAPLAIEALRAATAWAADVPVAAVAGRTWPGWLSPAPRLGVAALTTGFAVFSGCDDTDDRNNGMARRSLSGRPRVTGERSRPSSFSADENGSPDSLGERAAAGPAFVAASDPLGVGFLAADSIRDTGRPENSSRGQAATSCNSAPPRNRNATLKIAPAQAAITNARFAHSGPSSFNRWSAGGFAPSSAGGAADGGAADPGFDVGVGLKRGWRSSWDIENTVILVFF